jgi:uncharacterized protein YraI
MMLRRLLAIAAIGLGLGFVIPTVANAYTAFTTAGTLNVRGGPGVGFHKIAALPYGTPVNVLGCHPGWCRIGYWGGTGWVSARYISATPQRRYARRVQPAPGIYFRFDFGSPPPKRRGPNRYPPVWW